MLAWACHQSAKRHICAIPGVLCQCIVMHQPPQGTMGIARWVICAELNWLGLCPDMGENQEHNYGQSIGTSCATLSICRNVKEAQFKYTKSGIDAT